MHNSRLIILFFIYFAITSCSKKDVGYSGQILEVLKDSTLIRAEKYLTAAPITITSQTSSRSSGGIHDFYSEGDYWWPDTLNLDSPYIRRDGMTNPDNFIAHREALMRFSEIVGNLTSAYLITKDSKYATAAVKHCRAWFIENNTRMNPHLLYAQAIKGRVTGRGIGIIDAIHFIEVVQSLIILERHSEIDTNEISQMRAWFSEFLKWLTEHPYGIKEMNTKNNHATCWNMQAGIFAVFTKNEKVIARCRDNFRNTLLPNQMAENGSFPLEMKRTKPYGYALFNLDAMVMNCVILSNDSNNLWTYATKEGKTILSGLEYMKPYVADKSTWPLDPDVLYWKNWPVAHPSFLFGALIYDRPGYFELWKNNQHFPETFEVKRNLPIKNPLIWINKLELGK